MRWARACSDYTYTTLSDTKNATSCDPGCGEATRYKCKDGYTYSNGSCIATPQCTDIAATSTRDIISKDYATKEATAQTISTDAVLACGAGDAPSGSLYDYNYTISNNKVVLTSGASFLYKKHTDGLYYVNLSGYECTQYQCSSLVDEGFYAGLFGNNGNYCCKANAITSQSSTLSDLQNSSKCKTMPSVTPKKHHSLYYVCNSGYTLNGTKCTKAGSYSCPDVYKLSGTTCVSTKTECPEGYEYYGPSGTNKYACVKTVYTCPTNFEYTLSGNKCLCNNLSACSDYGLQNQSSANCGYGTTFVQDTVHKTDDYNNICGICKLSTGEVTFAFNNQECPISGYKNRVAWVEDGVVKYKDPSSNTVTVPYRDEYVVLSYVPASSDLNQLVYEQYIMKSGSLKVCALSYSLSTYSSFEHRQGICLTDQGTQLKDNGIGAVGGLSDTTLFPSASNSNQQTVNNLGDMRSRWVRVNSVTSGDTYTVNVRCQKGYTGSSNTICYYGWMGRVSGQQSCN